MFFLGMGLWPITIALCLLCATKTQRWWSEREFRTRNLSAVQLHSPFEMLSPKRFLTMTNKKNKNPQTLDKISITSDATLSALLQMHSFHSFYILLALCSILKSQILFFVCFCV